MPTVGTGVQNTNTVLSNRKVIDMADKIALIEDSVAPLVKAVNQLKTVPAKAQKVEWLEDVLKPRKSTANGASLAAATIAVAVGDGQIFRVGDVVRACTSGMNFYVTSISTDTITATRGIGSVADTTIANGEELLIVGNASAEGATLGTIKMVQQTAQYNYCQIQRDALGVSNTEQAVTLYGGSEPTYEKGKKYIEHMRAWENTAFFGRRNLNVSGSSPIGYAGGFIDYIATNKFNVGGTLTQATFEQNLQQAYRYGSDNKVFFCSPIYGRAISAWAAAKVQYAPQGTNKNFGIEVTSYNTWLGFNLNVVVKRDWQDFSTASSSIGSMGFLVDMAYVEWNPLRDTKWIPDRQAPDEDSFKGEYLTEASLRIKLEATHSLFYGTTAFS